MKKSSLKRFVSIVLAVSLLGSVSVAPRRADAAIILGVGGYLTTSLVIIGASSTIGIGGDVLTAVYVKNKPAKIALIIVATIVGSVGTLFGLLALDESGAQSLSYQALKADQIQRFGLTQDQATHYAQELPEINAVADQIRADLILAGRSSITRENLDFVSARWADYGAGLSPDSMLVLSKIGSLTAERVRTGLSH